MRAHSRIPAILDALREEEQIDLDAYWIPSPEAEDPAALRGFAGIWLAPGSPYRSEAGAVAAAHTARTAGIPFLGTCGGFQHAMLEFARNVCGMPEARHAENDEGPGSDALIAELTCSLVGHEGAINLVAGSRAETLLGAGRTVERYHCSYGIAAGYIDLLAAHGMRFSGHDDAGEVRVAELPEHPFFLATLFQPELHTDGVHPVIRGFAQAAARRIPAGAPSE
ncbi:CTP synthase [Paractinoplanes durhamensis]|uniref:CTP synthase (glutamine hydrolyzing) n=1 Tax=Paractinoplanes durhamensis TaxID=113563 RepID=A0ABQ3Z3M9_9ACTN|nr:CTP synthase [Actinoplanes durhamensis]